MILKKRELKGDEMNMMGVGKGGSWVYGKEKGGELMFMGGVVEEEGVGSLRNWEVRKVMGGKEVWVKVSVDDYVGRLWGNRSGKEVKS